MALSLDSLLELESNLLLLAVVIDDVAHDFVFPLLQLVLRVDILHYELLNGDGAVIIQVDLVKDLIDDLVAHVLVMDLLKRTKKISHENHFMVTYLHLNEILMEFGARDDSI